MIFFLLALSLCYADSYKIDVENSKIEWIGRKVTGEHDGNLKFLYGNIRRYLSVIIIHNNLTGVKKISAPRIIT